MILLNGETGLLSICSPAVENLDQAVQGRGAGNVTTMGSRFCKTIDISGVREKGGDTVLAPCLFTVKQFESAFIRELGSHDLLEQQESTSVLLFGQMLVDNFVAQSLIGESSSALVDEKTMPTLCEYC